MSSQVDNNAIAMNTQSLDFSDFSGGMTENYIGCALNKFQRADNLLLTDNGKLISRPGSLFYNETYSQIPSVGDRISSIIKHYNQDEIFFQSGRNLYWIDGGWNTLTGPTGNAALTTGVTTNHVAWAEWNGILIITNDAFSSPMKIYRDSGNVWRVRNAGLPELATAPTVTAGAAGANSYIYAFVRYYTYTVGTQTFEDFGPVTEVVLTSAAAPNVTAVPITAIPVLANGATENYATTAIKVKIYRSKNAGSTLYYLGEVTNGTTTYSDTTADASLSTETIYTEGDVVDNDPPPKAKYCVTASNCVYYGNVRVGSVDYPNRLFQSVQDDPDSVPADFFKDLEDEIIGLGSVAGYPIVGCRNRIYRIEGVIDELGRGAMEAREISRATGLVSHNSIVSTLKGLFFAGQDGFYFTNGFEVTKISSELNATYKTLTATETQRGNIYGTYDALEERIWWAVQEASSSGDNDTCFILDLRYGVKPDAVFTTAVGGTSWAPSALVYHNSVIVRADKRGYIFAFDDSSDTDPKVDTAVATSLWEEKAIIWDYKGPAFNCGTDNSRKFMNRCSVTAQNETNVSIGVFSNVDDSGVWKELKEIRYRDNLTWGDPTIIWGDTTQNYYWNASNLIQGMRRYPAGSLRCTYRQMRFTNSYTVIQNSDTYGNANVDSSFKTVTLMDVTTPWPDDSVDYYISFWSDGYENEYLITARTDTTLTFSDPFDTAVMTDEESWMIKGYKKGEVLNLISYSVAFFVMSDTQGRYKGNTGANEE